MTQNQEQAPEVAPELDAGDVDAQSGRQVPVAEAIKYRRRAQQAENRLHEVEQQLTQAQEQLARHAQDAQSVHAEKAQLAQELAQTRRRHLAGRLLEQAGAIDPEAAMTLLEQRVPLGGETDDAQVQQAVETLLAEKPYLVKPPASLGPMTASTKARAGSSLSRLAQAARRASQSGNRRDLAQYLRARRQSPQ